jgi:hypothetical protein
MQEGSCGMLLWPPARDCLRMYRHVHVCVRVRRIQQTSPLATIITGRPLASTMKFQ